MYRITLNSEDVPKKWYNINADLPCKLPEIKNSEGERQIENLDKIFVKESLKQETSTKRYIKIPKEVRELYMEIGRPSPLFRANRLEEKLNTPAKIFFKREDTSPTGSHKLNSAIPQAYFAKKEGIERLTTETGAGQWGTALSLSCNLLDLDCTVYMVKNSLKLKPERENIMKIYNGNVFPSPSNNTEIGRKLNKKNPNHPGSLGIAISEAVEEAMKYNEVKYSLGSLLNHVLLHQTVIGEEIKTQLEIAEYEADTIIACTGGGSNFGGAIFPFMKDKIKGNKDYHFIGVEPATCPSLTAGKYEYDFGDVNGFTPLFKMYTLGHDFIPPESHSGGLRYHGMSPQISLLHDQNYFEARAETENDVFKAGVMFAQCEGVLPAPETTHAIKVGIDEAIKCKQTGEEKTIVINFSGHGLLDLKSYMNYFNNIL